MVVWGQIEGERLANLEIIKIKQHCTSKADKKYCEHKQGILCGGNYTLGI